MKARKKPMTGSVAANPHEGGRSEILADYLFSGWGTVTPVRRQDDHGIDLYCTLTKRYGQRAVITDYFVVQVKSNTDPWLFHDKNSVEWLVKYPIPLFLACIDKRNGILRVYHVTPRFLVATMGHLPNQLELKPEDIEEGQFVSWQGGESFFLSAPILRVTLGDLLNEETMEKLRKVFTCWVRIDRENCELLLQGLLRFRMPVPYKVNEVPPRSIGEMGNAVPDIAHIQRGILRMAEGVECIGGQIGRNGDLMGALLAALLLDHFQTKYPDSFKDNPPWQNRVPGDLGNRVLSALNQGLLNLGFYQFKQLRVVVSRWFA